MSGRPRSVLRLHWLLGGPLALSIWLLCIAAALLVDRAGRALAAAGELDGRAADEFARLAAQGALLEVAQGNVGAGPFERGGVSCNLRRLDRPGQWLVEVWLPDGARREVVGTVLPGRLPEALNGDLTVGRALPELLPPTGERHDTWCGVLRRHDGIALLRLPAGTARPDYVLGNDSAAEQDIAVPESGVLRVDGNLWVDRGADPLCLRLDADLTVIVRGNLYLGRSLQVRGGRLCLVTQIDGVGQVFRDLDGNGRHGAGEPVLVPGPTHVMEGAGLAYLGLPGAAAEVLDVEAGLVVAGELHIGAGCAVVHGPVAVAQAVTSLTGVSGALVTTGRLLPGPDDLVPGFALEGMARLGRVRPRTGGDQTLYLSAPGR